VADPEQLSDRVASARRDLAAVGEAAGAPSEVEFRASASAVHLGLVARLVSPVLAGAVLGDTMLDLDPDRTRWRPPTAGEPSFSLWLPEPSGLAVPDAAGMAQAFIRLVLVPVLLPLEDTLHERARVSRQVLRGNLASALNGAVTVLTGMLPQTQSPADHLLRAVLSSPELAGAGRFDASGRFRRNNCCLYYRLPGGGLCSDCILAARP
jgi:hypothetical protein